MWRKKVDDQIKNTINKKSDEFWYKNNGIVILCENFQICDNKIVVSHFSILNGGQTSYMIGTTDLTDKPDFFVVCKIIKVAGKDKEVLDEFSEEMSIATNQQKKITDADLITNSQNVRSLAEAFRNPKIEKMFLIAKRGQKIPDELKKDKTKKIISFNLNDIGRVAFASFLFSPGDSKNMKKIYKESNAKIIFNSENVIFYKNLMFLLNGLESKKKQMEEDYKEYDRTHLLTMKVSKWFIFQTFFTIILSENYEDFRKIILTCIDKESREKMSDFVKVNLRNEKFFMINRIKVDDIEPNIFTKIIIIIENAWKRYEKDNSDITIANLTKKNDPFEYVLKEINEYYFYKENSDIRLIFKAIGKLID